MSIGNPPYSYQDINIANSSYSPSTIHVKNSNIFRYFQKYLLQDAISLYDIKIEPTWQKNYFEYVLFVGGFIGVLNTDKFGIICQGGGLYGRDVYYQPTHMTITNPLISKTLMPRIGVDCEIIKLQPDYCGLLDIVDFYAANMALCAETIQTNLVNSHMSYVFSVQNKAAAESLKKLYDKIMAGEPAVFADKSLYNDDGSPAWQFINQNVGSNFITPEVMESMRRWKEMFDTEIGIPNANTEKRERMNTLEVSSNNLETRCKSLLWLESMQEGCEKVNKMFGTDININLRPEVAASYEEVEKNVIRNDVSNGAL